MRLYFLGGSSDFSSALVASLYADLARGVPLLSRRAATLRRALNTAVRLSAADGYAEGAAIARGAEQGAGFYASQLELKQYRPAPCNYGASLPGGGHGDGATADEYPSYAAAAAAERANAKAAAAAAASAAAAAASAAAAAAATAAATSEPPASLIHRIDAFDCLRLSLIHI